jgi:hypothetical protein
MQGKLRSTVAVVRSFSNPNVAKLIEKLLGYGLGKVVVVVNAPNDKGATPGFLGQIKDDRLAILEMHEGYSWANALNLAMMSVMIHNTAARARQEQKLRFVLNVSVEALFTKEHIEQMLDTATDNPQVAVVGTSFKGKQNGNWISLGRSYRHPRNTGMLIRIEALGQIIAGFDARCDGIGGMEDIDFILRMLALSSLTYEMLDLEVPLIVGTNYHQPTKEEREQSAMDQIIIFWTNLFPAGSTEHLRIWHAIEKMGLLH